MKAVILVGGQGARIHDVNENFPKPMISVANLPILWHIMRYYACAGQRKLEDMIEAAPVLCPKAFGKN